MITNFDYKGLQFFDICYKETDGKIYHNFYQRKDKKLKTISRRKYKRYYDKSKQGKS